ncbi:NtaA/DmoA family FMN-dependent monooxygenase [Burkholderia sp. Ac-20345]|nr:NtaA/DmoA family FMN-dependent monooxygenase [Burkholderia sp. Ac-20345]
MHLALFLAPAGCHHAGWRALAESTPDPLDVMQLVELTRRAEAAKFDLVFMADKLSIDDIYGGSFADALAVRALEWPDPFAVLSALSVVTTHIGLAGTISSSFAHPFPVARTLATLDHLSAGRAGFNVVTSTSGGEARNFGATLPAHEERYWRAEAFIDALRTLWDTWGDDAIVADAASGVYARGERVRRADIDTPWFASRGPLTVRRPPQGHPVAIQAGGSRAFSDAAARHADVIFASEKPTLAAALEHAHDLRRRVTAEGRAPGSLKILPGLQPVIGRTRADAEEKLRFLQERLNPLATLTHLSNTMDYDWSQHALDDLVPDLLPKIERKERFADLIGHARAERMTVREFTQWMGRGGFGLVGTADDVATHMADWYRAGAVDGFVVMPPTVPGDSGRFFDEVVPRLQRLGVFRSEYRERTLRERLGLAPVERVSS